MSIQALRKIEPLHPPLIPPSGALAAGVTDNGKHNLFRLTRRMARARPAYDENGNRRWRVNRLTGEQVIPMNEAEIYEEHLLFYLESQGNGNVEMVQYTPETLDEKLARERALAIERQTPAFIAAMIDAGITPDKLKTWMSAGAAAPASVVDTFAEPEADDDEVDEVHVEENYPLMYGPGLWYLSAAHEAMVKADRAKPFKGKRDEAVAVIEQDKADRMAAKAAQELVPDF